MTRYRKLLENMNTDCRVCNARAESFAHAKILGRYDIEYFRCTDCQFVQTETPYWLDEAYDSVIVSTDIGLVGRNERFARIVDRLLRYTFSDSVSCVDYGGGYGMFTRMMRDRGHQFSHYDPYCDNLFASTFSVDLGEKRYDVLTAFEVLEHMANPNEELKNLEAMGDNWIVSTMMVPDPAPKPDEWWYYVLDGGQHVALWSQRALQAAASQYGRQLITTRTGLHLFCQKNVNKWLAKRIIRNRISQVLDPFRKKKSLLQQDFQKAVELTKRAA